ncbi:MAG TPA: MarP family serine protease [Candidatus Saccharimonadales bacterium]|nr:MarP family serine protease [Candidatus Saccharimonadales bacterium]
MNFIDLLIVAFVILSVMRGYRIGLIRQAGSTLGFILGLFIGSWLASFIVPHEVTTVSKSLTSLMAVLAGGFIFLTLGEIAGLRLKQRLMRLEAVDKFDGGLGSVMAVATVLFAAWLAGSILVLGPASSLQQALKNSRILSALNAELPPATSLLSSLNRLIDPNGFPQVFSGLEPNPGSATVPSLGSLGPVVRATQGSVVKVEGTGCGGIVEGSGFIIQPGEVVTNAHVVAGVANPKVIDTASAVHNTQVVWFDPDVDLAVLRVKGLPGKPLKLSSAEQPNNTPAVVLGYPGGGSFDAQPAAIMNHFMAFGRNIYDQGSTTRDVYSLRAHIIPGNSGGPVVGKDGTVLGIVFATSTTYNDVGYALTGHQVADELATAEQSTTVRGTGSCSE